MSRPLVLLLDDEPAVVRALSLAMRGESFEVITATTVEAASAMLRDRAVDVIVADERMPEMSGSTFLARVRSAYPDVARIMLTGHADVAATITAINVAEVFRFHSKPCSAHVLAQSIHEAIALRRPARSGSDPSEVHDRTVGDEALTAALESSWLALQPIVTAADRTVVGHEVLIRSDQHGYGAEQLITAASKLGRAVDLDRAVRCRVADLLAGPLTEGLIFINIFPESLFDLDLVDPKSPLAAVSERIVFEVTERERLEHAGDVDRRASALREQGYRLAIDDLGAGYAGLNAVALLEPEVMKFDATLTRDIHRSEYRAGIVESLIRYCRDVGSYSLGEGVETEEQAGFLRDLGCDFIQGYHIGVPERA